MKRALKVNKVYLVELTDGFVYRGVIDEVQNEGILFDGTEAFGDTMFIPFDAIHTAIDLQEWHSSDYDTTSLYVKDFSTGADVYVYDNELSSLTKGKILRVIIRSDDAVSYDKMGDDRVMACDFDFSHSGEVVTDDDIYYVYIGEETDK